jgi:hypothetical protein
VLGQSPEKVIVPEIVALSGNVSAFSSSHAIVMNITKVSNKLRRIFMNFIGVPF